MTDDEYIESDCWLCACGNYIEDGLHCGLCGAEPPWGCPCSVCQEGEVEEDESAYFDEKYFGIEAEDES